MEEFDPPNTIFAQRIAAADGVRPYGDMLHSYAVRFSANIA